MNDFINTYDYDALGRLNWVKQAGNAVADKRVDFTYDAASRYSTITRYADLNATDEVATGTYTFDALNRLTSLVYTDSTPSTIRSFAWTYDAAGNILSHDSDIASEDVTSYDYDETNQLTSADYTTGSDESYTYDDNGNRVLVDGTDSYTTGTNNRLISDGYYRYDYDDNGNLIARYVDADSSQSLNTGDTDITEYTWDHRNRMTDVAHKAVFGGSVDWTAEYVYDMFNRRIGSLYDTDGDTDIDREERYVWDGKNVVLDFVDEDGDGETYSLELTTRYLWGQAVDQLLAQETVDDGGAEDVLYPITDNLGSVRSLVNYLGQITATYSYDSFGNTTVQTGAITDTRYHFTGQEYDVLTAFYYYDGRWYNPATGKFVSEDPISFFGGDANLYRYVSNNPLRYTDPMGWCKEETNVELCADKPQQTPKKDTPEKNDPKKDIPNGGYRTWRSAKGNHTLRGKIIEVQGNGTIVVQTPEGKILTLSKEEQQILCPADQRYIKSVADAGWVVERDSRNKHATARAVVKGATLKQLADGLHLNPEQLDKWLRFNAEDGKAPPDNLSVDTPISVGTEFLVPNTIHVYWAGEWGKVGQKLVKFKDDVEYLRKMGFHVVVNQYGKGNDADELDSKGLLNAIKQSSDAGELYGFYFWGHGHPEGISDKTGGFVLPYADIQAVLQYNLGFVLLNCCYGGYKHGDNISISVWTPTLRDPLHTSSYQTPPGGLAVGGHDLGR